MKRTKRTALVLLVTLALALALLPTAVLADGDPAATEAAPTPLIIISREDIPDPIQAGQELEVTLKFQNLGSTPLLTPVATVEPPDDLTVVGTTNSFPLSDIPAQGTQSVTFKIKAGSSISSASLKLDVTLRFNFNNNLAITQASANDKVIIPAVVTKAPDKVVNPQPTVIVTRSALAGPISGGQTVEVTISFKNAGQTALVSPVASFSTSDGLTLLNDTSTVALPDIAVGDTGSVTLKLRAAAEISSTTQSVSTGLKFTYDNGSGVMESGSTTEQVNLASNVTAKAEPTYSGGGSRTASPVPNIIISKYSFGGDSVAAGSKFKLHFAFTDTGKLKIGNIVVTVEGGDSFTMDGSTNTFYYDGLDSGASQELEVPMQVLAAAKTGAQSISVGFKYDYVDGGSRSNATAEIKLSVPVYQPDRFLVNAPVVPASVNLGEETALSLTFVNKGKADVSNVEATVEGDVDTPVATQYLGNFESGKSGTIGFAVTPRQAGQTDIVLKISYEDANQKVKTLTFPVSLNVVEVAMASGDPTETAAQTTSSGMPGWVWLLILAALAVGAYFLVKSLKKKKTAAVKDTAADAAWEDWGDEPSEKPSDKPTAGVGSAGKKGE